ncbi:hypothetical protein [Desulfitibacter alkalitolerans]|uniref:hypothetical protein n=1 Tax=Desulfitibacter alkalitolerans TaxID=264641 RepID=UPI00048315A1|nr:hypothetical protein [Desulfitibacter alkalitolerans]
MLKHLVNFCDFCFKRKEKVLLYIFKTDVRLLQEILISDYEYENDYIIFKTDHQEEFLIMLAETKLHIRLTPDPSIAQYPDYPRERNWGKKIIFEIIDQIHGQDIIYSIGTNRESILNEYIKKFLN